LIGKTTDPHMVKALGESAYNSILGNTQVVYYIILRYYIT